MNGLGKLGTVLTVVFVVSLVALVAELVYVIWRRRRFCRQSLAGGDPEFTGESFNSPSKELLYFFCWKSQSRIEPDAVQPVPHGVGPPLEVDDVLKWQGLYWPSRGLFTIKEEEREEMDSENCYSAETGVRTRRVCLEESLVAVKIEVDESTPFSTPCASPPYYTPSPSPTRQVGHSEDIVLRAEQKQRMPSESVVI